MMPGHDAMTQFNPVIPRRLVAQAAERVNEVNGEEKRFAQCDAECGSLTSQDEVLLYRSKHS